MAEKLTYEEKLAKVQAEKAKAELEMMKRKQAQRAEMKGVFTKDIAGAGPQKEMRNLQTGAMKDLSSGAAARRGAEAGLRAQIAGAGARPGGAASKRALAKAGEAGVMGAGAQVAGSAAKVADMAGKVRTADVGVSKADKTARMKFHQLRMGEELAREGMKAQVSAASAGRSCFVAGTMVTMEDGSKKKIEHVLVGEKVLGLDNKVNTVLDYNRPPTAGRSLYSINDGKAFFTHEHPFYTLKGWKAINPIATFEELKPTEDLYPELLETTALGVGDEIVTVDGVVKIESIKEYEAEFFTQLYNFLLDGDHTYFADGYLVHNGGGKAGGGEMLKRLSGSYTHKNGKIKGPGTETSDSIKARLSDGEFVVNAKTVRGLGEALGAKGKHPTRQKGSAYLYALQSKYGDKKDKDTKGILPVKMSAGGFTGMQAAKLASQVAKTGILGKGAKAAGEVAGAGIGAHEEGVKAKKAKVKAKEDKDFRALQTDFYKSKAPKPVAPPGQANAPKVMGPSMMPKTLDEQEKMAKDGGEIKFGKGVKARKKFLDSIGHKPFKHFEDKAEKDYKEGATGYKNLKKRQNSNIPGAFLGMTAAGIAAATSAATTAAAMAKAESDRKKAVKQQEAAQERQAGVEAGKSLASSAQGVMKADAELKDGGKVSKDHPHYKFLKDLEDWQEKRNKSRRGKKVDLDPGRKADKAIRAKKGSIEPVEMEKGGDWRKEIIDKIKDKWGHVLNRKALRKKINKAIKSESGKRKKKYESNMKMEQARKRGPDNELAQIAEEKEFRKKQALKAAAAKRVREDKKALVGDASYLETITKEKQDEKLFQDQLKSAKGLGMKVKKPISKKAGVGVEYNPFKKLGKKVSKFFSPDLKDIDPSRLTEKEKKILEDRKYKKTKLTGLGELVDKKKRGKQEKLVKKFRKELKEEQPAVERESERRKKVLKKEEYEHLAGLEREKSRQQKSDDRLAKGIAEKALKASKLRRGIGKGSKQKAGKRVDLLATDKTKKLINQHGPDFAKKIKKHMKELEPLVRSEKIGKETHSPEKIKGMKKHYEDEAASAERKKRWAHETMPDVWKKSKRPEAGKGYEPTKLSKSEAEVEISKRNPKARKFLLEQGKIPHEDMTIKERFADRARKRAKQDDKEAKDYEKKAGFFGKLGDRLSTGEWFGSSKDILAAKRRAKDKEQAKKEVIIDGKVESTPEEFKRKKALRDDKIAMAKEMDAERKKGIEAKVRRENPFMAKPKVTPKVTPKVAPKVDAPKTKTPEVKEVKKKKGLTSKQWADMGLAAGMTGLKAIAKSKQDAEARKRAREAEIRKAKGAAGKTISDFGTSVMGMDTRLKHGGRVSFKDVLKAKKKMGY